ncbi:uncharacterized protein BDV14DRAFT_208695 [Aspergillus stella-maris]|uniref:uncharacterized protein n=1 Tax=Aspergillus stella-maris TaxID=1810926 RepID=UPI003CCCB163
MQSTLPLLRGFITLSEALDNDDNILRELIYPNQHIYLYQNRTSMEHVVWGHLGFHWPGHGNKSALIRFPLPYKVCELRRPGNAEEKLRCEAAMFLWLQANCPSFTAVAHAPLFSRTTCNRNACSLTANYLVMDCIEGADGAMLSEPWECKRQDPQRRSNLFRGLSHIMLSLAQIPFHRIGFLTVSNQGVVSLINCPLTLRLQHLENENVPTHIETGLTHSTSDAYLSDLLACHYSRLRHVLNSVRDEEDGREQLSILTIMRALLPHFMDRDRRHRPFYIVDLEWICSRPLGMHFEKEELTVSPASERGVRLTRTMRNGWNDGKFWYCYSLDNPQGLYNMFQEHIKGIFTNSNDEFDDLERTIPPYWRVGALEFIAQKLEGKQTYDDSLRAILEVHEEPSQTEEA